jgi:beta-glucosidase
MPWRNKAEAILYAMYGGSENGTAISDVLFGEVNPSGKLPFTIAESLTDYPPHALGIYDPENCGNVVYEEGIYVGYRWMDEHNVVPIYPFGYGLSYTTFEWGKAAISSQNLRSVQAEVRPDLKSERKAADSKKVKIKMPVTNVGMMSGSEVVQLYISDVESSLPRPEKELKRFCKLFLEPGETKLAEFEITEDDLRFFDPEKHLWVSERGEFRILLCSSATQIEEELTLNLK